MIIKTQQIKTNKQKNMTLKTKKNLKKIQLDPIFSHAMKCYFHAFQNLVNFSQS